MNPHARRFVSQGHLVDSGLLTRMLNLIVEEGADYEVLTFKLGRTNQDESQLELEVRSGEEGRLEQVAAKLVALGCYERKPGEGVFRPAPRDIQKNNTKPAAASRISNTAPACPTAWPAVSATPAAPSPTATENQNRI